MLKAAENMQKYAKIMPALRCPVLQKFDSFRVDRSPTSSISRSSTSRGSTASTGSIPTSCNANSTETSTFTTIKKRIATNGKIWMDISFTNRADYFQSQKLLDVLLGISEDSPHETCMEVPAGFIHSCACLLEKHRASGRLASKMAATSLTTVRNNG